MKRFFFHPFLIALYSVLALFSNNVDRVGFGDILRTCIVLLAGVGLLFGFLWLLVRNEQRAALVCTLFVILFTSYTHVYDIMQRHPPPFSQANVIAAAWAGTFILLSWWLIRVLRNPQALNEIFNIASLVLILFPVLQIIVFQAQTPPKFIEVEKVQLAPMHSIENNTKSLPDVYYIILDEYGRSDVLRDVLGYDNSAFIRALEDRGFYVADESTSNYAITLMSLASSLNQTYINDYTNPDPRFNRLNNRQIIQMIRYSRVRDAFAQAGYRFIAFETGYLFSEIPDADLFLQSKNYMNDFEVGYINTTILTLASVPLFSQRTRDLVTFTLDKLVEIPETLTDRPKFVFVHIPAVHAPFVFGPNGEEVSPWTFAPQDSGSGRTYTSAYQDQATYINQQVLKIVDTLTSKSKIPPVIILQGDHGPQSQLDWTSVENTCIRERMSILNAYYLPGVAKGQLYPSITPVNTFRVIMNNYLGQNDELLEDRPYFALWAFPYQFIDVTDRKNTCRTE